MTARRSSTGKRTAPTDVIRWAGGVHVEGTRLWCDAPGRGLCFVSACDVALPRQHAGRLLCTDRTARLIASSTETLITPYRRPFSFGKARLELLPAGRLPGSAQLHVEMDGQRMLYAGRAISVRRQTAEARQSAAADVLIVDAPEAASETVPAETGELARLGQITRREADRGLVIVVVPDALAVEVAAVVSKSGCNLRVHRRWTQQFAILRELGVELPRALPWRAAGLMALGEVVLWPVGVAPPHEGAAVLTVGSSARTTADERHFVVGDSLDLPGLIALAAETEARTILMTSGFSAEVAAALAGHGIAVRPLGPPTQIPLL